MSIEVYLWPQTEDDVSWLQTNFQEFRRRFLEIHLPEPPEVAKYHPHDVYLEQTLDAFVYTSNPLLDHIRCVSMHVRTGGHWSRAHADRTAEDFRKVIRSFDVDPRRFRARHTGED